MNETEKILREELQAMHEALSIIADNLTNDDGQDPEAWWLELTADQANLIRAIVKKHRGCTPLVMAVPSEQPWPPMDFIPVERCEHGTPKGYLCRDCDSSANNSGQTAAPSAAE